MINWVGLVSVLVVTIGGALAIVLVVGLGIRLLAMPSRPGPVADARDEEEDEVNLNGRPRIATFFAVCCFIAFAAIIAFGIWLLVPAFH
ncbi:MAG TPA: hypothetical protein VNQ52_04490 [Microbacteriaceae bacterium]|nr:hypothetical protein [Microbacteriaceae bacterium]